MSGRTRARSSPIGRTTRRALAFLRRVARVLGVGVVAVLIVLAAVPLLGRLLVSRSAARWTAGGHDLDETIAEARPTGTNASALRLERLALGVGLNLTPKAAPRRTWLEFHGPDGRPSPARCAHEAREPLESWLQVVLPERRWPIPEPPGDVAIDLAATASDWPAVEQHLREAPLPRWAEDWEAGLAALMPLDVLAAKRLGDFLIARALLAAREGRRPDAVASLEAAWRWSVMLEDADAVALQHVLAMSRTRIGAAVLTIPDMSPGPWIDRLSATRQQRAAARQLALRASLNYRDGRAGGLAHAYGQLDRDDGPLELLSTRSIVLAACGPQAIGVELERLRMVAEAVDEADPCPASEAAWAAVRAPIPEWNPLVRYESWNPAPFVDRAWHSDAHAELTVKALEARETGGLVDAQWSASRCPDFSYTLTPTADGGFEVALVGPLPAEMRWLAEEWPLRHVEAPPP